MVFLSGEGRAGRKCALGTLVPHHVMLVRNEAESGSGVPEQPGDWRDTCLGTRKAMREGGQAWPVYLMGQCGVLTAEGGFSAGAFAGATARQRL